MKIAVFNHGRSCNADGIYMDGTVKVLKGSRIFLNQNCKFDRYAEAFRLRSDPSVVDPEGTVLKDCLFKTPSAAAVFVAGSSRNGNDFWRVEEGKKLGVYLEEKGVITRKTRAKK